MHVPFSYTYPGAIEDVRHDTSKLDDAGCRQKGGTVDLRRKRAVLGGVMFGATLGIGLDVLLFIAPRSVDFMLVHGAISGSFGWTAGSAPISILTSPLALLLGVIAGVVVGYGAGEFAASLMTAADSTGIAAPTPAPVPPASAASATAAD
jgi:hypothetical protein